MKRLAVLPLIALLTACQPVGGDAAICTPIVAIPPIPPTNPTANNIRQIDIDYQRAVAEHCIHRTAYRLSGSPDPAETVANAVAQACEGDIAVAAAVIHKRTYDANDLEIRAEKAEEARLAAISAYDGFALLKVVEGRAGHCKAN